MSTTELAQIDSKLRLMRASERALNGAFIKGPLVKFDLVRTEKHWELGQDGAMGKEISGPPEWRIDCAPNEVFVTVATAIRHVTQTRGKSSDPIVKQNADRTIEVLKELAKSSSSRN